MSFQLLTERREQIAGKFRRRTLFAEVGKRVQHQPLHAPLAGKPAKIFDGLFEGGVAAAFVARLALNESDDGVGNRILRGLRRLPGQRRAALAGLEFEGLGKKYEDLHGASWRLKKSVMVRYTWTWMFSPTRLCLPRASTIVTARSMTDIPRP